MMSRSAVVIFDIEYYFLTRSAEVWPQRKHPCREQFVADTRVKPVDYAVDRLDSTAISAKDHNVYLMHAACRRAQYRSLLGKTVVRQ